jgi:hypothetical protein
MENENVSEFEPEQPTPVLAPVVEEDEPFTPEKGRGECPECGKVVPRDVVEGVCEACYNKP